MCASRKGQGRTFPGAGHTLGLIWWGDFTIRAPGDFERALNLP